VWDFIKDLLGAILPPKDPTPERQRRWGFAVAGVLIAMSTWTVGNTVLLLGLLPPLFGDGFARADALSALAQKSDLARIERSLDALVQTSKNAQIATLGQQIYNLHVMECNARKAGNGEAARSHAEKLEELKFNFRQLAGYEYSLQSCAEL
jgi:hypothetical protein